MARGSSHRGSRDSSHIANPVDPLDNLLRPSFLSRPILDPVHDLRIWNPTVDLLGPLEISGLPSRGRVRSAQVVQRGSLTTPTRTNRMGNQIWHRNNVPVVHAFRNPNRVPVCVRRSQRREVLFARGRAGGGNRKPRWTERSYIRCR